MVDHQRTDSGRDGGRTGGGRPRGSSVGSGPGPGAAPGSNSGTGLESASDSRYSITSLLSSPVPGPLARRAISVSVTSDRDVYAQDEAVSFTVAFRNRLPVSVAVPTPRRRRWDWSVDGELEASDERRDFQSVPSTFRFSAGERKEIRVTWNGRFERTVDCHEYVVPEPGEYEIRAFVATEDGRCQPSDSTLICIR
ncbi:uncharacterized protein Nmag_1992 [Natrialba magadii ATCC 43099]|uniref:DUF7974 domain-containing protein n=1 Tax=Natrialba magadii (strain ATCC 43099 / DSM 3394 / CCM 3739 / CIP 104546 / IAM 13178 / JCM 8861 / NBRC 102185 / NCIMB 2190 / MS3) TaxID=547559 RepID=D3SVF5_NATMM|nr:hypothetical protein [Natrialba magadii]ADD05563.1 uncharacterized protein Nmag_1992 [Natrialba magadii ATCC 43099]ELY30022.1 hypothetical protein C500_10439 [Natrialba magadii ATCC 43099]